MMHADQALAQAIAAAADVERGGSAASGSSPLATVAFGHVIRSHRLGGAVAILGCAYGHEARALVRGLLESYFNYAWIRLDASGRRATRFLQFHVVEQLQALQDFPPELRGTGYEARVARLTQRRTELSGEFREVDARGKARWAKSWAAVSSVDARMAEVQAAVTGEGKPADRFLYLLYRWFSGVVHGSPHALGELMQVAPGGWAARSASELATDRSMWGAALAVSSIARLAGNDLVLPPDVVDGVNQQWAQLSAIVGQMPGVDVQ